MNHLLHHVGDKVRGTVEVFLDVGTKDISLTREQQAFLKAAASSKRKVGAVVRQYGGTTLFSYAGALSMQDEMNLVASMAATLGSTDPVIHVETSPNWENL